MDSLLLDLRHAVRALFHRPGFAALAILTLAIGIGVNTVAFSAINGLVLKPFKFEGSRSLGWIMGKGTGNPYGYVSLPDYQDLARSTRAFDAIVAEGRMPLSMRAGDHAEQVWSLIVSTNYLTVLSARPSIGRLFTAEDLKGTDLPVVVSHRFWNERLGGGGSVAGRTIAVNGQSFSIVGVLPDDFQGPGGLFSPDLWIPLDRIEVLNLPGRLRTREDGWLSMVGRIKDGVSAPQAEADLRGIFTQLAADHPATNTGRSAAYFPMIDGNPEVRVIAKYAWLALAVVGLVLLIACLNVAGLLLARASERQKEIGVRAALGASRARIMRQLVTEGALLAILSGIAALVVASWSSDLLGAFSLPSPIPQRLHLNVDRTLVAFTVLLVAIAGVVPALLPAFQATRADSLRSMKMESATGGRPSRTRNMFVVAQVAGSTLFLAAALLFVRSFLKASAFDPGFDTKHSLVLQINPAHYGYDLARTRALLDTLTSRIAAVPGVQSVSAADRVPFYVGRPRTVEISIDGTDCGAADCRRATTYAVGRQYFSALGVPLEAGRDFTPLELKNGAVVIISGHMAAQLWPGEDPVGRSFREGSDRHQVEVIGVAADIKHRSMGEMPDAYMYRPLRDADLSEPITVIVRTSADPRSLLGTIQGQVGAIDPSLPVEAATMTQRMELPLWPAHTIAGFFLICGTLALVLATVGLFGVTYYAVTQRTREFGIRVALGATRRRVVTLVLREGLFLTLAGVILGIAGALIVARLLASTLFELSPADPLTFGATALIQAVVALAACALPAYRATKADPMVALRQD